jgi:hypothetical protein
MTGPDEYKFHIDAYSPETIPMARLAEYMTHLASMLGQPDSVHFVRVEGGSTSVVHCIENEAAPKVRTRLQLVGTVDAPKEANTAYQKLNTMLYDDNAVAELILGGTNILRFPGREIPRPPKMGPFNEHWEIDGVLVRIGGKDASAHAMLEDSDGETWSCEVSRSLAKDLAHHLFGTPLRIRGTARWFRSDQGDWVLSTFKGETFEVLDTADLRSVVTRIRNITADWDPDSIRRLKDLRDDDEVH